MHKLAIVQELVNMCAGVCWSVGGLLIKSAPSKPHTLAHYGTATPTQPLQPVTTDEHARFYTSAMDPKHSSPQVGRAQLLQQRLWQCSPKIYCKLLPFQLRPV